MVFRNVGLSNFMTVAEKVVYKVIVLTQFSNCEFKELN